MDYIKITFSVAEDDAKDVLIAMLSDAGYSGFEEAEHQLLAYIEEPKFHPDVLKKMSDMLHTLYVTEVIPAQNWNEVWESNFEPVIVDDFCTVRADFHDIVVTTPYEIIITPKMSFGTGHHATTQLMLTLMREIDLNGKSVLDFGTGTGVLAIFAEQLSAASILGIDHDEWSVENAVENVARNHCKNITIMKGSLEDTTFEKAGVILANINRHILLEYMDQLYQKLANGGQILMSGLLAEDEKIISETACSCGFIFVKTRNMANWIALLFQKI